MVTTSFWPLWENIFSAIIFCSPLLCTMAASYIEPEKTQDFFDTFPLRRHSELDSESSSFQEIAGQARNDAGKIRNAKDGILCKPTPFGNLLSKGGEKPLFDNIHSDKYRKLHSTSLLPKINIRKSPFERGCPPQRLLS